METRKSTRSRLAAAALVALGAAAPALGEEPEVDPAVASCAGETGARLRFLEGALEGDQRYADLWWKGWGAVYVGGLVIQGTRAAFEDEQGQRADMIVSAAKSGIGLARNLWSPPPARLGAEELMSMPTATVEECEQRRARAEAILHRNAEAAREERRSWIPHLANLGLNLAGAVIVAEGFDESDGWVSGAVGFAVGEGRIWSYPWQAGGALEEYQRRFPASGLPTTPPVSWQFESWGAGARVTLRY
jgi:hypothetical protein